MPTTCAVGKELGERVERDAIVAVVEGRHEHDAVGDVEVGVARRQPLAVHHHRARERQLHHAQRAAAPVAREQLEPPQVVHRAPRGSRRAGSSSTRAR